MSDERDRAIGDLLRAVPVPGHAPGYWESLDARLEAQGRAGAAEPAGEAGPAPDATPAAELARRRRRSRAGHWWRPALAAAAFAACVLAFVAAGLPGLRSTQPEPATAAEVVARVVQALDEVRQVSGIMVERAALAGDPANGYVEKRARFWLSSEGDWAELTDARGPASWGRGERLVALDADAARLTETLTWAGDRAARFREWRDAPVGTPDGGVAEALRFRAFARVVDAFRDADLVATGERGRAAWLLTATRRAGERWPAQADTIELVVDKDTALPARLVIKKAGQVIVEQTVEDLAVDLPVDPARFAPRPPEGATRQSYDAGYRQLQPGEIAAGLPFPVYVPGVVPDGFVPRSAALARREWRDPEAGLQWEALALPAALFSWRRGFDELSVSTRPYARTVVDDGQDGQARTVDDPFEMAFSWMLMRTPPRQVTLRAGALAGLEANLVAGAWAYPHLWVVVPAAVGGEQLVVTVAGDATEDELVAVAESLAPVPRPGL